MPEALSDFFRTRRSYAETKQEILEKLFEIWCSTQLTVQQVQVKEPVPLLYLDLYAGPAESDLTEWITSPAKVLESLYRSTGKKHDLNESVRTFFSGPNKEILDKLQLALKNLSYYTSLTHPPMLLPEPTSQEVLEEYFNVGCRSLIFTNPFEYNYAQEMLVRATDLWQPDLFMLFNPDNIKKALTGRKASPYLTELFGERFTQIKAYYKKEKDNAKRQEYTLKLFVSLLQEKGYLTFLFRINEPSNEHADHYLLFSTLDKACYRSFKEMVLPYSNFEEDGVPIFVANKKAHHQLSLFPKTRMYSVQKLMEDLVDKASQYKYKAVAYIYEEHSVSTNYIRENYLSAFEQLQQQGKVELKNPKTMQIIRKPTPASIVKFNTLS
ncbi:class I SAM-dependent methyltransferase [Pontibacter silvestris]|nr:hypothetical protein [Pontibacter silvestris]